MSDKNLGILFLVLAGAISSLGYVLSASFLPVIAFCVLIFKILALLQFFEHMEEPFVNLYSETLGFNSVLALFHKQKIQEIEIPNIEQMKLDVREIIKTICLITLVFLV